MSGVVPGLRADVNCTPAEAVPGPALFVALTEHEYDTPPDSPWTVIGELAPVAVKGGRPVAVHVTVKLMIGLPAPAVDVKLTVARPGSVLTITLVGAPGSVSGMPVTVHARELVGFTRASGVLSVTRNSIVCVAVFGIWYVKLSNAPWLLVREVTTLPSTTHDAVRPAAASDPANVAWNSELVRTIEFNAVADGRAPGSIRLTPSAGAPQPPL